MYNWGENVEKLTKPFRCKFPQSGCSTSVSVSWKSEMFINQKKVFVCPDFLKFHTEECLAFSLFSAEVDSRSVLSTWSGFLYTCYTATLFTKTCNKKLGYFPNILAPVSHVYFTPNKYEEVFVNAERLFEHSVHHMYFRDMNNYLIIFHYLKECILPALDCSEKCRWKALLSSSTERAVRMSSSHDSSLNRFIFSCFRHFARLF